MLLASWLYSFVGDSIFHSWGSRKFQMVQRDVFWMKIVDCDLAGRFDHG
jgi:fatty-acid desaturase